MARRHGWRGRSALVVGAALIIVSCGGGASGPPGGDGDPGDSSSGWVADLRLAVDAVEAQLGSGQRFFEVTANPQLTNVFVASEGAAIPYVFRAGRLLDPAPPLAGATGSTFTADQIDFDERTVLSSVERELPDATIDALSVEGGPNGLVRYIVSARSAQGGVLDIEVAGDGAVLAVDPV